MSETKYDVCFVQSCSSRDDVTENLKIAFESMETNDLQPVWVSKEDCLQIHKKEAKLFVMDPFQGEIFDHLVKVKCRVVGPLCVSSCLQLQDTLPKRPYPVYSVSMRRMSVSCSNIEKKIRDNICKKVELMGGIFSKDLTKSVTHLVVGEVGSKKYHVAANFGLPIMLPEWVESVWDCQDRLRHANDEYFHKFKCPIFKGLVICVSQLSSEERSAVQSIVESNGGKYCGALKAKQTTHLILTDPTGEKYRFAKTWKIFCIKVSWIHDSIKYGYCRDENLYPLDTSSNPPPKRSTPLKDKSTEHLNVDCSVITSNSFVTHLDETTRTEVSMMSVIPKKNTFHALEAFDVSSLPKYGQFLDGCKIFLTGFNNTQVEKLRKIVNAGGGMRFSKYSDSISHVVCGELPDELLESIRSSSVKPHVVNFNWLLECCTSEKMVDEIPFLCIELDGLSPQKSQPQEISNNITLNETAVKNNLNLSSQIDGMNQENITDIFKQYINENEMNSKGFIDEKNSSKLSGQANDAPCIELNALPTNVSENVSPGDKSDVANDEMTLEEEIPSQQLFKQKSFIISGFGEKDTEILSNMIETYSGTVLPVDSEHLSDIAVVPLIWKDLNLNANQVVTNCWLQKCIEESQIFGFEDNEMFKPLDVDIEAKPLQNAVLSVSQYSGTERDCLMHLAEVLGATCQEYFVRKANKSKGVFVNTHLIACTPEGSKYEAAKKWKIPAITKYWLLESATSNTVPPEEDYLVENVEEFLANRENIRANQPTLCVENVNPCEDGENKVEEQLHEPEILEVNEVSPKLPSVTRSHNRVVGLLGDKNLSMRGNLDVSLNKSIDLRFNVSGLINDIDTWSTPETVKNRRKTASSSDSLGELFNRNLTAALENAKALYPSPKQNKLNEIESKNIDENSDSPIKSKVLTGVIVCVAKKLANYQIELNEIVTSLGGEYLWSYDKKCTHYVFQGKLNDLTKEFRLARNQGKSIVSPDWLYACREENALLSETLYPHTYKSRMSLTDQISTSKISIDNVFEEPINEDKKEQALKDENEEPECAPVDFNKELNELLAAAKFAKRSNSKRLTSSGSSSPINDKVTSAQKRHFSDAPDNPYHRSLAKDVQEEAEDQNVCSQPSQTYPITWDDPTGRLEREKIAARLAASKSADISSENEIEIVANNATPPEISLVRNKSPKFMFTGYSASERSKYEAIVKNLGGDVCEDKPFDLTATHLILDRPLKNEKFLASIASGKFILHSSYLLACAESQQFVSEETFEWGGVSTSKFLCGPARGQLKVANCPHRWRTTIHQRKSMLGAFHEWTVVIYADERQKHNTYATIVKAGGAKVVPHPAPESVISDVTHVFVESKKDPLPIDLNPYLSNNAKCLKPEYLAFYLVEDPPPPVDDFLLPGLKDMSDFSSSHRKRTSAASKASKRIRLK